MLVRVLICFALFAVCGPKLCAQPAAVEPATLRGESPQTRKRLAEAELKVLNGKAADAVEELQRLLDEAGDDLISVDGRHHRPARWIAHQILAKLPADVLKTYRDRIDEAARKLLEAGRRDRDPKPLWQLLDRYFVSRAAEEGSLLLGDLLFERGDFRTAELLWKRLLPDPDADINYPGPKTEPVVLRARIILAAIFEGETARARDELAAFKKKYAGSQGSFAGKTGPYAETLQFFLDSPPSGAGSPPERNWPTLGGDPGRSGRIPGPIPIRRAPRPSWIEFIPQDLKAANSSHRPPFGHPVIFNGWVYVTDGHRVLAFELTTGQLRTVHGAVPEFHVPKFVSRAPDPPVCPSLSAANGRLYARLGYPIVRPGNKSDDSAIVCFAPLAKPGKESPPLREQWRINPPAVDGKPGSAWEGAPLLANGRMWAAFARFEGGRIVHGIACYDPADCDSAPLRPAWVAEVSDSPVLTNADVQARARQELITLAGRNVVFCSNTGAVVALDAVTGRRAWAMQYPRSSRRLVDANRSPDPSAAVAAGGRVFLAPADAEHVFALDAETGAELWESGRVEGGQILGVARNRVILNSTGPVRGIRGLSAITGSYRAPEGWIQANGLLGYGQGMVSDDLVLWPSRDGLWFLDPATGRILCDSLKTMTVGPHLFGNLAFADGWLVVVTPTQVWAYHTDAPPYVRPPDLPRERFQTLIDRAERDLANGRIEAAREALVKMAIGGQPKPYRAWAAARLLSFEPRFLVMPEWLSAELSDQWLLTADGEFATLGQLVDRRAGRPPPTRSSPGPPYLPADRKPLDAPSLDGDATIVATIRLPPGSIPLRPITGSLTSKHAFFETPGELLAIALDGEKQTRFERGSFTHAADLAEGFVAAGPQIVAVFGKDREPRWTFHVPETDPLPRPSSRSIHHIGEPQPPAELSSFSLAGNWLFARLGERHLIALDLKAGVVAWVLGTHGHTRYESFSFPTAPCFTPLQFVSERLLVAQLTDGRRWSVQTSTGRVWNDDGSTFPDGVPAGFGTKSAAVPWVARPIDVDAGIAFSDGPGLVRFEGHSSKRTYEVTGETSLTGEPPQLRRWGEFVGVAVRRNYGVELDRMDSSLARSAWTGGSVFLDAGHIDLAAADADSQRIYVPAGAKLLAFDLDDGRSVWEAKLPPAAKWIVHAGRKVIIAHPAEAIPDEPFDETWHRLRGSFLRNPQPWRLPWLTFALYDSWIDRTLPVLVFDPETGKRLKTLRVPAFGPIVATWFDGDTTVVATGDRICWLK
jgi:outer membrane protein assembly factor BamB